MLCVEKLLASTAPSSIFGPFVGQDVIQATRVLQKRTNPSSALANDLQSTTVSLDEEYILPVKWPHKRQRRASSVGATQPSKEQILRTLQRAKLCRRDESVGPPSSETVLFDGAQCDVLLYECTAEAPFKDKVSINWFAMREDLRVFPFCAMPISTCPYPCFCRPP